MPSSTRPLPSFAAEVTWAEPYPCFHGAPKATVL